MGLIGEQCWSDEGSYDLAAGSSLMPTASSHEPPRGDNSTVIFAINVDWFFISHFQYLARCVLASGHEAVLATHIGPKSQKLEGSGIHLVHLPFARNGLRPGGVVRSIRKLRDLITSSPRPILHAFGNMGIIVGTLATMRLRGLRLVYTITGRGYAAAAQTFSMRAMNHFSALFNRLVADGKEVRWIVENTNDIASSGLSRAFREGRVTIVGGAGVDPAYYAYSTLPARPPLRIGFVSRLIWSKGLDIAVRAIEAARAHGCDVTLTVAGRRDLDNPRAYTEHELAGFSEVPGIEFIGHVDEVPDFWAMHHLLILPSRGGEGLPRCLLEAASCGRPVLVSRVPGCAEFASATRGWTVTSSDSGAFADAIIDIVSCPDLDARGAFARSVVQNGYSEDDVWEKVRACYFG